MKIDARLTVPFGKRFALAEYDTAYTAKLKTKEDGETELSANVQKLRRLQDVLAASRTYAVLLVFEGTDASGKDGAIKHVLSGLDPGALSVTSFKAPTEEELAHEFLWRCWKALPKRGTIGAFNRSYYEEVAVARVDPTILTAERLPPAGDIWSERFEDIGWFERYLVRNGTIVIKFFLNLSKDEQRRRFLDRIDTPEKSWKLLASDIRDRGSWDAYRSAYESMIERTNTEWAPWYVIPADHKWFARAAICDIVVRRMSALHLSYPKPDKREREALRDARARLGYPGVPPAPSGRMASMRTAASVPDSRFARSLARTNPDVVA